MRKPPAAAALALTAVWTIAASAHASPVVYDVRTGLDKSILGFVPTPSIWSVSAATQTGEDNWWYRYDTTAMGWWTPPQGAALTLDAAGPTAYPLMGYAGNDTRSSSYGKQGWAWYGSTGNDPLGYVTNFKIDKDSGTAADAIWMSGTNNTQNASRRIALEWKATEAGTADVAFEIDNGTNGSTNGYELHLFVWDDSESMWTNHSWIAPTEAGKHTIADTGLALDAGDSIFLFMNWRNTGGAGYSANRQLSGGVTFTASSGGPAGRDPRAGHDAPAGPGRPGRPTAAEAVTDRRQRGGGAGWARTSWAEGPLRTRTATHEHLPRQEGEHQCQAARGT